MKPYYVVQWRVIYNDDTYGWEDARDSHLFGNKFKTADEAADRMRFLKRNVRIIKRTDEVVRTKKAGR